MKKLFNLILAVFLVCNNIFAASLSDFKTTINNGKLIIEPNVITEVTLNDKTYKFSEKDSHSLDTKLPSKNIGLSNDGKGTFEFDKDGDYITVYTLKKSNMYYLIFIAKKAGSGIINVKIKDGNNILKNSQFSYTIDSNLNFTAITFTGDFITYLPNSDACDKIINDSSYDIISTQFALNIENDLKYTTNLPEEVIYEVKAA